MDLDSFNFHPRIAEGIRRMGYTEATPIQEQAIPPIMEGRDVVCLAQTGTGKTAVFVLPILEHLMNRPVNKVRALVLSPTRELAEQTQSFFKKLGSKTRLRFVSVYGGVNIKNQIDRFNDGVEVVVGCPGRILDHLQRGTLDLSNVEVLVIDEADRMFDMGFMPDVRRIVQRTPRKRQTLLFSATMPDDVRRLTNEVLRDPETIEIRHSMPAETVSHAIYPVKHYHKTSLLFEILKMTDTDSVLVFTRTKHRARRVGNQLERRGYKAASLRGDMSQNARKAAISGFRKGAIQVLVATDIAARGLDISSISHVINYDIPDTPDNYIHRIGRTGRAETTGDAFTFVSEQDERTVRSIERVLGEQIERRYLENFDYDAPAPAGRPPQHYDRRRGERHKGRQERKDGPRPSGTSKGKGHYTPQKRRHGKKGGKPKGKRSGPKGGHKSYRPPKGNRRRKK